MHIIVKLITGEIVIGEIEDTSSDDLIINKPYTYISTADGNIGLAPYDATLVQGKMSQIKITQRNVLYTADLKDLPHILSAYRQSTTNIILGADNILQ